MSTILYSFKQNSFHTIMIRALIVICFSGNAATIETLRQLSVYTPHELEYCCAHFHEESGGCSAGLKELLENEKNPREVCELEVPWFREHEHILKELKSATKKDIEFLQKYKHEYKKMDWVVALNNYNKPSFFAIEKRITHLIDMIVRLGINESKNAFVIITGIHVERKNEATFYSRPAKPKNERIFF